MAPNPKRPSRPRVPAAAAPARKKPVLELPFDDEEVTPLQADDPRPQRVPQYPVATAARKGQVNRSGEEMIPTSVFNIGDEAGGSSDALEYSDPGFAPLFIYVDKGPGQGQLVPLKQGRLVIGRASLADLRLQHPSISRRHAQISRDGNELTIKDLGSQNGTYVNKSAVGGEVVLEAGDVISMGSAVLKVRGPAQAVGEDTATVPPGESPRRKKAKGGGLTSGKMAALGLIGGLSLAAIVAVAVVKLGSAPRYEQLPQPAAPVAPAAAKPVETAAPESDAVRVNDDVDAKIREAMAAKPAEAEAPVEAEPTAVEPPADVEIAADEPVRVAAVSPRAEAPKAKPAPAPRPSAKAAPKRSASANAAADSAFEDDEAPAAAKSGAGRAQVLARYEAGDVAGAMDAAREAGAADVMIKLNRFKTSYEAGKKAVSANDAEGAIKHLGAALKLDEELSSGWSKFGVEIRKQLSDIWTKVGALHLSSDRSDDAEKAYAKAVKYDPENAKAKAALAKLKPAPAPAPKAKAAPRSAIDDAFGDESEPAPARPAKKKPTAASIDDAFND